MKLVFLIAGRYLRARKGDGFVSVLVWFSLIGIALGVATLIIVMSVMNGFRHDLQVRILGINGHVTIESATGFEKVESLRRALLALPDVVRVTPMIDQQVLLVGKGRVMGALSRGIRARDLRANPLLADNIDANLKDYDQRAAVLIGEQMAWNLGLSPGDSITVMTPQSNQTAFGKTPRRKTFRVAGTFAVGMTTFDSSYLFMPLDQARKLFRLGDRVMQIEVTTTSPDANLALLPQIRAVFADQSTPARISPWQERHASFFQALKVERNVMFIILSLVVLIAAFNIVISQVMMVRDKAGSIAILRAVGARRTTIMGVFFTTGALIGGIGTTAGVLLGVSFSLNIESIRQVVEWLLDTRVFAPEIYFLSTLPSRLEVPDLIATVGLALMMTFGASMFAAFKAARLDPLVELRHG